MTDQMAASIERNCEMYKRPYLLSRSTDLHKFVAKMFALKLQLKAVGPSL